MPIDGAPGFRVNRFIKLPARTINNLLDFDAEKQLVPPAPDHPHCSNPTPRQSCSDNRAVEPIQASVAVYSASSESGHRAQVAIPREEQQGRARWERSCCIVGCAFGFVTAANGDRTGGQLDSRTDRQLNAHTISLLNTISWESSA
jgi:hypothetical protein